MARSALRRAFRPAKRPLAEMERGGRKEEEEEKEKEKKEKRDFGPTGSGARLPRSPRISMGMSRMSMVDGFSVGPLGT